MTTIAPKLRTRTRLIAIILVLSVVLTGAYAIWFNRNKPNGQEGEATWSTAEAAMGDLRITVTGMAPLQAGHTEAVKGTVGGIVRRVYVQEGDDVSAGQTLAVLENEDVMLNLEQAQLAYQAELDRLDDLRRLTVSGSSALRIAELNVQTAKETVDRLEAQVAGLVVKAPAAGVLTDVKVAMGEEVSAGATLATVLEQRPGRVTLEIPEGKLAKVSIGSPASVVAGPLPTVHVVKLGIGDVSVYALRIGDPVTATIDGSWISPGHSPIVRGTVVEIVKGESFFDVTVRLPGIPQGIPPGAKAPYIQLFPSGVPNQEETIVASGVLSVVTDEWGLATDHAAGKGLPARVVAIAPEGKPSAQGGVTYTATIELDAPIEGARTGMSAHASIPIGDQGEGIGGVTSYQAPYQHLVTQSGGKVLTAGCHAGKNVAAGDVLFTMSNPNLLQQLEQARINLDAKAREYRDLSSADRAGREVRAQEIKVRQAELALLAREEEAGGLTVIAGTSGRVVGWHGQAQVGLQVSAGVEFCRLINYSTMSMTLKVDELQVVSLRPGMEAEVIVDALPGRPFSARVKHIANEGSFEQGMSTFDVVIEVEGAPELRAQMTANATIYVAAKSNVLVLPAEAVTIFGNGSGEVSVVGPDGKPQSRQVTLGLIGRNQIEIVDGLRAGESVVLGRSRDEGNPGPWGVPGKRVITK